MPRDVLNQKQLEIALYQESFLNRNQQQRRFYQRHYFKFLMYRNPLERLISGYRSKVDRYPLLGLLHDTPHYNWLRKAIYLRTHPDQYLEFIRQDGRHAVNISFIDFVTYWVDQPTEIKFDDHFRTTLSISQPCRMLYNFYGNFKNFEVDSRVLMEKIYAKPQFLKEGYYTKKMELSTEELAIKLYAELNKQQKLKILEIFAQDLDFYYHIFPEEEGMHKSLLGINSSLPKLGLIHPHT